MYVYLYSQKNIVHLIIIIIITLCVWFDNRNSKWWYVWQMWEKYKLVKYKYICRSNHHDRKLTEKNLTLSLEHFCLFCCCCQRNLFMYNVKFFLVRKNSDYRFSQSFFVIFSAMYKIPMHNKWYIALNVM